MVWGSYTIPAIGRFAIAERETFSGSSAERGAAVQTSEAEEPLRGTKFKASKRRRFASARRARLR